MDIHQASGIMPGPGLTQPPSPRTRSLYGQQTLPSHRVVKQHKGRTLLDSWGPLTYQLGAHHEDAVESVQPGSRLLSRSSSFPSSQLPPASPPSITLPPVPGIRQAKVEIRLGILEIRLAAGSSPEGIMVNLGQLRGDHCSKPDRLQEKVAWEISWKPEKLYVILGQKLGGPLGWPPD
ncbi:uncharacterized protein LOC107140716 isoform X4 [Marmota marmota marmota]|uniref:uncharacterized protein LOC107140716 isoform X4 n=2 Tax=Marmota TaxID=9992 RepID=UPI00209206D0|nr:uncharacterized protein LOC107140716 isoform X4 [Marmota marmota marmota]XP_048665716.1 uncharacterized protein LOC107140716 isoform X4 [Marmota marmota marmota]